MAAQRMPKKSADALRSIGEAAKQLGLQAHVLRYWETKFPKHVKPIKRGDGRRLFRPGDISALRAIQILVHERGMTLKGAKALLAEQGVEAVLSGDARLTAVTPSRVIEPASHGLSAAETLPQMGTRNPVLSPAQSPARDLQRAVGDAFASDVSSAGGQVTGSKARLKSVLGDMTDIKRRLDALRAGSAA